MAVQWGLAQPQFNALQVLQSAGMAQQNRLQQQALALKQQEAARQQATQQNVAQVAQGGNYRQAQQAAIAGGDFDLARQLGALDDDQRKRAAGEAEAIGRVAQALTTVPVAQRQQELQRFLPMLQAQGITPDEIAGADLSDHGLNRYVSLAQSINDQIAAARPSYQVIPEGGTLVNTRDPNAVRQFSGGGQGGSIEAQAQAAIAAGADPAAVQARLRQLQGGAPSQGGATFP